MPLETGKSKAAFSHNVATEMHAGKPQKQAVAIAYSQQRKGNDMAKGYSPVKGSINSLAELNAANQRYNNQLEGETTFENTGDAAPGQRELKDRLDGMIAKYTEAGKQGFEPNKAYAVESAIKSATKALLTNSSNQAVLMLLDRVKQAMKEAGVNV